MRRNDTRRTTSTTRPAGSTLTASTALDGHVKTLSYHLLALELLVWERRPGRANMCATI
jgi:hypothetical protein